jgi:hypothetical protein
VFYLTRLDFKPGLGFDFLKHYGDSLVKNDKLVKWREHGRRSAGL